MTAPQIARTVSVTRRRPSGGPPPLPRPGWKGTRRLLVAVGLAVVLWVALATGAGARLIGHGDLAVLGVVARLRSAPLTRLMDVLAFVASPWVFRALAWSTLVVLLGSRRFQHLLTVLGILLVVPVVDAWLGTALGRMRPAGVEILGAWDGYSHPSRPLANLALGLTVVVLTLVPPGPWRPRARRGAVAVVAVAAVARLYLAVDHPTDVAAALVVGVALPLGALLLLTPEGVFPVRYRQGVRAHLDVGGRRGEAIRAAVAAQLGVRVTGVEPFGSGNSAGSTPMRLVTEGGGMLFGKLYAAVHLRSDRWYKLARTVRYGRLEDERPFNTVRRLVQYEDHMLRVAAAAGLPAAGPHGIVEITPEREYLLVTEFLDGAVPLDAAEVTEDVIDAGLACVLRLWHAGLAHRDIKPANVLVRQERVYLVDLAFAEMRPTPWRQAVDLANMMLVLALPTSAPEVYRRALAVFSPDEIAEAFAAARSVTIPAQLRALLRADGRDLLGAFRALAPSRPPVAIQRWSLRRLALTAAVAAGALMVAGLVADNLRLAGLL